MARETMTAAKSRIVPAATSNTGQMFFAVITGIFFFIAIIKLGDPVILAGAFPPPQNAGEVFFESWPVTWGYWMMLPVIVAGLAVIPWKTLKIRRLLILPAAWLGWQFISATHTVSPKLSALTLEHFTVCVILFYLGCFALQGVRNPWPLWTALALALCWFMRSGLEQHFGGLEATRKMVESMKNDPNVPPGMLNNPAYLARVASNRIFATFSNADALAAGIELLLPVSLFFLWQLTPKVRTPIRCLFLAILGGCGLACLYWTGSKAGWLVTLVMGAITLWRSALPAKWKRNLICVLIVIGVAAFAVRYATSYKKQNVSVGTRISYWKAAMKIAVHHPILGTGPGTFGIPYAQIKEPEADFAHLCHNDYLEQACDSGFPGLIFYAATIFGCLLFLYRYRIEKTARGIGVFFVVWLGLLGICLHCLVDYHLYTPALAWPMFFLLGFAMNFDC